MNETQSTSEANEANPVKSNLKDKKIELKSLGEYNKELSQYFDRSYLKRDPMRLSYFFVFVGVAALGIYLIKFAALPFILKPILGIIVGMMFGGMAFISHELLHGAVLKDRKLQDAFSLIGFAPFIISPTYWRFWHNKLHHGNTQLLYKDPDAFPTKMIWKRSKFMRFVYPLSPGSKTFLSYFYFFYWFSFQAFLNQVYMRFGNKMWEKMDHRKVTLEFTVQVIAFTAYVGFIGVENWLWLWIIPFAVQNYTVMSYISTNHNLSPYTRVNDPLMNSLSVTNHPLLEKVHLNFGYHTEHHLFPSMPMSKAKEVHKKLKELYPDRYKCMPKKEALKRLYSTSRIYKNRETLINPFTDEEYRTLGHE